MAARAASPHRLSRRVTSIHPAVDAVSRWPAALGSEDAASIESVSAAREVVRCLADLPTVAVAVLRAPIHCENRAALEDVWRPARRVLSRACGTVESHKGVMAVQDEWPPHFNT